MRCLCLVVVSGCLLVAACTASDSRHCWIAIAGIWWVSSELWENRNA